MFSAAPPPEFFKVVPRYDYQEQFGNTSSLLEDILALLVSGEYVLGPLVTQFENAFANYCGCAKAKGVNSGTDAILIALKALGIGPGDAVIFPANTFNATAAAIELAGATPVPVDAEQATFLLDQRALPDAINANTRVIIPVHLFGKPVQMEGLLELASRKGIMILEDAAQAHGASVGGKRVGSFGIAGCFSFHPSKNLAAAGDGGAIVTDDLGLSQRIDLYRALGQVTQNEHVVVGLNSKLDSLQALILSAKLSQLDGWNNSRKEIAGWYISQLAGLPISFQAQSPNEVHVYHLFQLRTVERDRLLQFLKKRGIDAVIRYPVPIHLQPAFRRRGWRPGQFPVAESLAKELLCLPLRPHMPEGEVAFVIDAVRDFYISGYGVK